MIKQRKYVLTATRGEVKDVKEFTILADAFQHIRYLISKGDIKIVLRID